MTLLSICQGAADEMKITRPVSIFGSVQPNDQSLLRAAQKVGYRLMTMFPWQILRTEKTFTSVATEVQTAILPSDFDRFVPETFWNRTDSVMIPGPISATEWQGLKANSYAGDPKFILRGGAIAIQPTMEAGKTLAFEYVSNLWCQDSTGTGQSKWAADTDTGVLNEELITLGVIFEYLDADGQPSERAAAEYQERFKMLQRNDNPGSGVLTSADIFGGNRHYTGTPGWS